jgi:hypothetical protein
MLYIYPKVDDLEGTEKVGSKQCVALLQHYAKLSRTALWKEGKAVFENMVVAKGTAIATFVDGKYGSLPTGNHAAFYIAQDHGGIWIMDQWLSDEKKPLVSKRYLRKQGKWKNGQYIDPSNNANAYSVIE